MEISNTLIKILILVVVLIVIIMFVMGAYTREKNPFLNATGLIMWK